MESWVSWAGVMLEGIPGRRPRILPEAFGLMVALLLFVVLVLLLLVVVEDGSLDQRLDLDVGLSLSLSLGARPHRDFLFRLGAAVLLRVLLLLILLPLLLMNNLRASRYPGQAATSLAKSG